MRIDATPWCPEWGSNPHWEDFKSSASAIGLSGPYSSTAADYEITWANLPAFSSTKSNCSRVNLPVNVFCWLG